MRSGVAVLLTLGILSMACGPSARLADVPPTSSASSESLGPAGPLAPVAYIPPQCVNTPIATVPPPKTLEAATSIAQANPPLTTAQQLEVLDGLVNAVRDHYVYPEAVSEEWLARAWESRSRVEAGLDTQVLYAELPLLVQALGDEHSYYQTPQEVIAEAAAISGTYEFVGVGALFQPIGDGEGATVLAVFEGGSAWHAGLQPHDALLAVDGGPIRDAQGMSRTRGPECSAAVLTIRSPGGAPRDLMLIRSKVSAPMSIDPRWVSTSDGSKVGYLFLPTLLDEEIPDTVRLALEEFGPLDGLILDNRMNGGGLGSSTKQVLGFFTSGVVGSFVTRESVEAWEIPSHPVHNSLDTPLVVLVSEDTVSYGEILSGVLEDTGRARLIGEATLGNVEQLRRYDFADGSRAWLASARFEPLNSAADWEQEGLTPEIEVIADWETFTFESDPAIAAALEVFGYR